jgi:hypothetical protein
MITFLLSDCIASNLLYYYKAVIYAEVGIANFFLSPLIANPLIFFESAKR